MVMKKARKKPTEAELAILRVLWQEGPSTVRQVHEILSQTNKTGYTTILKTLQIMHEKGLVARSEESRAHIYFATATREHTQGRLVTDLLDRAFDGSRSSLVIRLLDSGSTPEEIAEIRKILDEFEGAD